MNKPLTIIMVGMSSQADWDHGILNKKFQTVQAGAVNRNFHVLQHLLKRPEVARVIHVDFLPFTCRKVIKQAIRSNLWRSQANTQAKGLTWRLDAQSPKWWSMSALRWQDLQVLDQYVIPDTEPVVWSYHPFFPQVYELLPQAKKVFDTVDNWAEHPVYAQFKTHLKANYNKIQTTADTIFTVSPDLTQLFPHHPHVKWVANGVDAIHFSQSEWDHQFTQLPKPFVVYVGVIQDRLDAELLTRTAQLTPDVHFVLAGPVWEGTPLGGLKELNNVHFIGSVPYQQLPGLLHNAKAGIIPHRVNRFTASMNPLKLYEYLASGLPVVSTRVKGTEQFSSGISLATTPEEFSAAITQALHMSEEDRKKLRLLVQDQTWDSRVEQMIQSL